MKKSCYFRINSLLVKTLFTACFVIVRFEFCRSQETVSFLSADSLKITADLYLKDYNLPFILLFHEEGSSRGEFNEIAVRLLKLEYNCLAVDLRVGDKMNYVNNETARRAREAKISHNFIDAKVDIEASVRFIRKFNQKPVILFGSSYSASLCLLEAAGNPNIHAVIAFSPGEYFRPEVIVKNKMAEVMQPVFVSSTQLEYDFIVKMLENIPYQNKYMYKPTKGKGEHGAKMLWKICDSSDECWLELLLFFKRIRY
jgi:hypothetical protein